MPCLILQISSEERRKQAIKKLIQTLPDNYEEIAEGSLKEMLGVLLLTSGGTDVSWKLNNLHFPLTNNADLWRWL